MTYRQWEIPLDALSEHQKEGLAYWRSLTADGELPSLADFEIIKLPPASLPTTHIADVIDGGKEFRYRFWGSKFRNHLGYDGTGITFSELRPEEIRDPVREANRLVVREKRPIAMMSEFTRGEKAPHPGFQRFLRLPLGTGGNVLQVVSLVEFLQNYQESRKIIEEVAAREF